MTTENIYNNALKYLEFINSIKFRPFVKETYLHTNTFMFTLLEREKNKLHLAIRDKNFNIANSIYTIYCMLNVHSLFNGK